MVKFIAYGALLLGIAFWIYRVAAKVEKAAARVPNSVVETGNENGVSWGERIAQSAAVLLSLLGAAKASALATSARTYLGNPFKLDEHVRFDTVDYESKRSFLFRFQEDFERVLRAFVPEDRVYVFVDDLDRCEPQRAAELLQAMTVMFPEQSKIVAVLAIDRAKVAAAVAMRSDKILPLLAPVSATAPGKAPFDARAALELGQAFLEKLVQLSLRLPRPGADELRSFVSKLLGERSGPSVAISRTASGSTAPIRAQAPEQRGERMPSELRFDPPVFTGARKDDAPPPAKTPAQKAVARESDFVREMLLLVAPALGSNPRRLAR